MAPKQDWYSLAIVGGGPRATYVLERISAEIGQVKSGLPLRVHVYEQTGEFGTGLIHSPEQSATNLLNRTCRQVAFAADESFTQVKDLRPRSQRRNLYEWCRERYLRTQRPEFRLGLDEWPQRRVHGLSLREMFQTFVSELNSVPNVNVFLHPEEVTDIKPDHRGRLIIESATGSHCTADRVLLVTGHPSTDPGQRVNTYARFASRSRAQYVPLTYPFEKALNEGNSGSDRIVGLDGMGLVAIDYILYLTEGRGGLFEEAGEALVYMPSGSEPIKLVAFSESGMFPHARPENFKERGGHNLEHKGVFFKNGAIDRLRAPVFCPAEKLYKNSGQTSQRTAKRRRLSFKNHLMPLVQLEMAYVHYATLFGPSAAAALSESATPAYERFLSSLDHEDPEAWCSELLKPIEECVDEIADRLGQIMDGHIKLDRISACKLQINLAQTLKHWLMIVFGTGEASAIMAALAAGRHPKQYDQFAKTSRWLLDVSPQGNRFCFASALDPVEPETCESPEEYKALRLEHMRRDLRWAKQGNVRNPYKAAADGVWRDLRGVFSHAVDNAGLSVESYPEFLRDYFRLHNKLANGPGAIVIKKLCALVEAGILDISIGPGASVECDPSISTFRVTGCTGSSVSVDVLLDARTPSFDARRNAGCLYQNLLRRGLVRLWTDIGDDGATFVPGFLDVTPDFHPINQDGKPTDQITVLGPAAALANFFQFSLLRPNRNHAVMREIVGWLTQVWNSYNKTLKKTLPCPTGTRSSNLNPEEK